MTTESQPRKTRTGNFEIFGTCGFRVTRANRQTDRHTNRQTDRQTDTLIALLSTPTGTLFFALYEYTYLLNYRVRGNKEDDYNDDVDNDDDDEEEEDVDDDDDDDDDLFVGVDGQVEHFAGGRRRAVVGYDARLALHAERGEREQDQEADVRQRVSDELGRRTADSVSDLP